MTTRLFLQAAAAFWLLFGLIAGVQVWTSMITHGHPVPWLLGYHVAVWIMWLAPTALIAFLARRFPVSPFRPLPVLVHVAAATVIGLLHALYALVLMWWWRPYEGMTATPSGTNLWQALLGPLLLEWVLYLLVLGVVLALEYSRRSRAHAVEAEELRRSLLDARLHALELQLQPHFLFNTLNAIAGLVRTNRHDEAIRLIAGLGDLLRHSLDHAGRQRVTLGEEVEVLTRFLEIHQARFPDRMAFTVTVDASLRQAAVPILILQPLVENAVRHGVEQASTPTRVEVRARREGDRLVLHVSNDGRLASPRGEGVGMRNTRERLRVLYGDHARFAISEVDGAVIAVIDLPFLECA